jgi:2-polyprenyl-3-methyl-5-hydroxy-6-metoxy-1,4-benzoquinol methylase
LNAARAVGLELNRGRMRQAETIARFKSLHPEYIRGDIEEWNPGERFDIILCLNILHHLRNPIGVLRKLALATKETLVIEAASLGSHDAVKLDIDNSLFQIGPFRFGPSLADPD